MYECVCGKGGKMNREREPIVKTEGVVVWLHLYSIKNAVFVYPKHKTNKGNTEHKTNKLGLKIK